MLASYTALDMAGRIAATQGRSAHWWLAGGSFAMGIGIWSMHFIGMLAFNLPIPMGYDPIITVLSLLIAIASSAFALWLVCQKELSSRRLGFGALLMGAGISAMHYTGMAAMRMSPGNPVCTILVVSTLGQALNLKIVAEGVETRAQQDFLTRLGCNSLQGFLLGRPMPPDRFISAASQGDPAEMVLNLRESSKGVVLSPIPAAR